MTRLLPKLITPAKTINSCSECRFSYYIYSNREELKRHSEMFEFIYDQKKCSKTDKLLEGYDIPDWCPLEVL